jgi:hypothetical protein
MSYNYKIDEIESIMNSPPSYVKITQVPTHGNIKVQQMGEWVALRKGDMVETSQLNNFVYDG